MATTNRKEILATIDAALVGATGDAETLLVHLRSEVRLPPAAARAAADGYRQSAKGASTHPGITAEEHAAMVKWYHFAADALDKAAEKG